MAQPLRRRRAASSGRAGPDRRGRPRTPGRRRLGDVQRVRERRSLAFQHGGASDATGSSGATAQGRQLGTLGEPTDFDRARASLPTAAGRWPRPGPGASAPTSGSTTGRGSRRACVHLEPATTRPRWSPDDGTRAVLVHGRSGERPLLDAGSAAGPPPSRCDEAEPGHALPLSRWTRRRQQVVCSTTAVDERTPSRGRSTSSTSPTRRRPPCSPTRPCTSSSACSRPTALARLPVGRDRRSTRSTSRRFPDAGRTWQVSRDGGHAAALDAATGASSSTPRPTAR